jgi:hypothetical protein
MMILIFPLPKSCNLANNKVLKWQNNIRILSSYHVGSRIWNHNSQFVTLKKLHMNLKLNLNFAKKSFFPFVEKWGTSETKNLYHFRGEMSGSPFACPFQTSPAANLPSPEI